MDAQGLSPADMHGRLPWATIDWAESCRRERARNHRQAAHQQPHSSFHRLR